MNCQIFSQQDHFCAESRFYGNLFLADTGYDSKENKNILKKYNLSYIIPINKRNNHKTINETYDKKIYYKRTKIENIFCLIKKKKRMLNRYEQKI